MLTDPISDMLTRINNANQVYKAFVNMPASKEKAQIAQLLQQEGYLRDFKLLVDEAGRKFLRVYLKYTPDRVRVISGLRRISKPGRRVYSGVGELPKVQGGMGVAIVSTSKGLMTDRTARSAGVGGEVICFVW
jgi:small subunit ribosomal protein S8